MLYDQQKPPPFVSKYPDIFLKKSFLFPRKKHYFFFFSEAIHNFYFLFIFATLFLPSSESQE